MITLVYSIRDQKESDTSASSRFPSLRDSVQRVEEEKGKKRGKVELACGLRKQSRAFSRFAAAEQFGVAIRSTQIANLTCLAVLAVFDQLSEFPNCFRPPPVLASSESRDRTATNLRRIFRVYTQTHLLRSLVCVYVYGTRVSNRCGTRLNGDCKIGLDRSYAHLESSSCPSFMYPDSYSLPESRSHGQQAVHL